MLRFLRSLPAVLLFFCLGNAALLTAQGGPEDTLTVQTFTYGSPLRGWFQFPPDSNRYRKVWLYYKLKCDKGTTQDNYPCGEWDYLTYTYLYEHTGLMDSTLYYQPSFEVKGASPDSFAYKRSPVWTLRSRSEKIASVSDSQNLSLVTLGKAQVAGNIPLSSNFSDARSFSLWTADELLAAGLQPGKIYGMELRIAHAGSPLRKLRIGASHINTDSIYPGLSGLADGLTVYERNTTLADTGWQAFVFDTPFNWDGQSNILFSFSFDNYAPGEANLLWLENKGPGKQLIRGGSDHFLFFRDNDYVEVPAEAVASLDQKVSISIWVKGNPGFQPQNDYLFEARNADDQRLLNVHFPWSNGRIYWDAGNDGSGYDRIDKAATSTETEGAWNHWVFIKDASAGIMRIYKNGAKWHEGSGRKKSMAGISTFLIGANVFGSGNFDGAIDEFAVWDTVLSPEDIARLSRQSVAAANPAPTHLLVYYPFDEDQYPLARDQSGRAFDGRMFGLPGIHHHPGQALQRDFADSPLRPAIRFIQGISGIQNDTRYVIDSLARDPLSLVLYGSTTDPSSASDTLMVWEPGMQYNLAGNGRISDSMPAKPDTTIYRSDAPYYGAPFEVVNRYELLRYITPYGIGLDLGAQGDGEGFTWKIDVTDFAPLLADSVELSAGNNQEFLDMKFVMIKGTPPRDVKRIRNVYTGGHRYDASLETEFLVPKTFQTREDEKGAKLRITNTGHGFGGNRNCAEFCPTNNDIKVNGSKRYGQYLWRDNCDMNPVYPQGGTWIYSRTNWCPGAEVNVDEYELTPFYTPGDSISIDYDMEAGYNWNGQGSAPYWRIEAQLITYGAPNFRNDAEIEMIISPNKWAYYKRFNPICSNPVVRIRNSGSEVLKSLTIRYGVENAEMHSYQWSGNLAFMESEEVTLPLANFGSWSGRAVFVAKTENPNGVADEHPENDMMKTEFEKVPQYPPTLIFWLRTNAAGNESHYKIFDQDGNVVKSGDNFKSNTLYKDTLRLDTGCYRLVLYDRGGDGLSFFANNDGNGYARLMDGFSTLRQFQPNFGAQIAQSFTVGYPMTVDEGVKENRFTVYPNPGSGDIYINHRGNHLLKFRLRVYDARGRLLITRSMVAGNRSTERIELGPYGKGLYLLQFDADDYSESVPVIIQ